MTPDRAVEIGAARLTPDDVVAVARGFAPVAELSAQVAARMAVSREWVAATLAEIEETGATDRQSARAYYGVNTGFGAQAGRSALSSRSAAETLGHNLIASHCVGVGAALPQEVVRAAMLIRAQALAQGLSGVRPVLPAKLIEMLNARVFPLVPELGSLGASGDLAPFAHLLLTMSEPPHADGFDCRDGEAFVPANDHGAFGDHVEPNRLGGRPWLYRRIPGREAMRAAGGKIRLEAKEALAMMNGATVSAAIAAIAVHDARTLLASFEAIVALTLEGIGGFRDPFYPQIHAARGHAAAEAVGRRILAYLDCSGLVDRGDLDNDPERIPPQDPYSLRCVPQVFGSAADTLELAHRWTEMDVNAVTDNPLIFPELPRTYKAMSGGNFHGEPIAFAMDFLAIALTELANMSDRRMFLLTAGRTDDSRGLPPFLIDEAPEVAGLNSGLMMLQATAAAIVSDCKTLASPDSVDSIPSSGNQEDHVSMSLNAARHARTVVEHAETVAALELLCAAQAVHLRQSRFGSEARPLGRGTSVVYRVLREAGIAPLMQDRVLAPDIAAAIRLVRSGALVRAAREATC